MSSPLRFTVLLLALVGCGGSETGAVRIVISYAGPRDGCLVVRVAPTSKPTLVEERRIDKLPHLATRTIGVLPVAENGQALTVEIDVHERGCDGALVWKQELKTTAARPTALLEAGVLVRDLDDDTWADGRGSFAGGQRPGSDCDDMAPEVHPGAVELCNGLDDDCNGVRDDGLPPTLFFVDADHDGWGTWAPDSGQTACVQPPGFSTDAGDCDDTRDFVHPGAVDGCDGLDDNCDSVTDEGFHVGESCDAGATCSGTMMCSDAGTSACFSATALLGWYLDDDGDGHGRTDAGALLSCSQPPGRIANSDDCDDTNRFIHVGASEVCDGKDDDCDPATVESCTDAGLRGFTKFPLPTFGNWKAIAPFSRGFAWVVGDGNQIILRYFEPATGTPPVDAGLGDAGEDGGVDAGIYDAGFGDGGFLNYFNRCSGNFKAAWATPSGRLYLAEGNKIDRLELDAGCQENWASIVSPNSDVTGLSGHLRADGGVTLYASAQDGRTLRFLDVGDAGQREHVWAPDASNAEAWTVSAPTRSAVFVAGIAGSNTFYFAQNEADGGVNARQLAGGSVTAAKVNASSALGPSLAYFGANNNTLFRWDGVAYAPIAGPFTNASHFSGVCAFGEDHVIAVDTEARMWRYSGSIQSDGGTLELWVDLKPSSNGSLKALAATAPDDVWVAGDNNAVLHFGE